MKGVSRRTSCPPIGLHFDERTSGHHSTHTPFTSIASQVHLWAIEPVRIVGNEPWSTCAITDMLRMFLGLSMIARNCGIVKFTCNRIKRTREQQIVFDSSELQATRCDDGKEEGATQCYCHVRCQTPAQHPATHLQFPAHFPLLSYPALRSCASTGNWGKTIAPRLVSWHARTSSG